MVKPFFAGSNTLLASAEKVATTLSAPSHARPVNIEPALNEVRNMPEFQPEQPGLLDAFMKHPLVKQTMDKLQAGIDGLMSWIQDLFARIDPGIAGRDEIPEFIFMVLTYVFWAVVIFFALVIFYLLLTILKRHLEEKAPGSMQAVPLKKFDEELLITAAHHQREAKKQARAAHYEEAVRQMYLALLCLLDETRLVPFEATRSNREYLKTLNKYSSSQLSTAFQELARLFESTRYGHLSVDAAGFEHYQAQYQDFVQASDQVGAVKAGGKSRGHGRHG